MSDFNTPVIEEFRSNGGRLGAGVVGEQCEARRASRARQRHEHQRLGGHRHVLRVGGQ